MPMVVDASFMLALLLPDEELSDSAFYFSQIIDVGMVVPAHWNAEISNAMVMALRRQRITAAYRRDALLRLADLPIDRDMQSIPAFFGDTLHLSDRHKLSAYDASYLELALRLQLPLATMDKALAASAIAEGVKVFGPYQ